MPTNYDSLYQMLRDAWRHCVEQRVTGAALRTLWVKHYQDIIIEWARDNDVSVDTVVVDWTKLTLDE